MQTTVSLSGSPRISTPEISSSAKKSWKMALSRAPTLKPSLSMPATLERSYQYSEMDLTYLTSRLIVFTTAREPNSSRSRLESIRKFLDDQHSSVYQIFSLDHYSSSSASPIRKEFFHNRVIELSFIQEKRPIASNDLLFLCEKVYSYLFQSSKNIAVLHSSSGKNSIEYVSCALIAYGKIFPQVEQIINYYEYRRLSQLTLTKEQKRYIQYLSDLSFGIVGAPHFKDIIIQSISFSPVPLFNRQKNGCRPYVELFNDEQKKIFSNYQEPHKIRSFLATENLCTIPLNVPVRGDVIIRINHAPTGISLQATDGGIRICQLKFHSNFSTANERKISYEKNEMECSEGNDRCCSTFRVVLQTNSSEKDSIEDPRNLLKFYQNPMDQAFLLFRDRNDFQENIDRFTKSSSTSNVDNSNQGDSSSSPLFSSLRAERSREDLSSSLSASGTSSPQRSQRFSVSSNPQSPSSISVINPLQRLLSSNSTSSLPRNTTLTSSSAAPLESTKNQSQSSPSGTKVVQSTENQTTVERSASSNDSKRNVPQENLLDFGEDSSPTSSSTDPSKVQTTSNGSDDRQNTNANASSSSRVSTTKGGSSCDLLLDPDLVDVWIKTTPDPIPAKPRDVVDSAKASPSDDLDETVLKKVREWKQGKTKNIRSLLCSLSSVIWPESGWKGCQMHELVTVDQVKKAYRKAVLYIHPDKLRGDPNENLAKLIFVELNEAWSHFEQESNR